MRSPRRPTHRCDERVLYDLNQHTDTTELDTDVLVVGAGLAGLVTATRLAQSGLRVVVLESGGRAPTGDSDPLNEIDTVADFYAAATEGRVRCLGGTSTRWGGAMLPLLPSDISAHPTAPSPVWNLPYERLLGHLPELEARFGLPPGGYDLTDGPYVDGIGDTDYLLRFAKWPPFRLRNAASVYARSIQARDGPEIWLHAHLVRFVLGEDGSLRGGVAMSPSGCSLTVSATEVILASGAIESTRQLLLLDRQAKNRIFMPHGVLGTCLGDHLSAAICEIVPHDPVAFNQFAGFRFQRGAMRNLRYEMTEQARLTHCLPANFVHFAAEAADDGGFAAVRDMMRDLQARRPPSRRSLAGALWNVPWILRALWWRGFRRRLLFPKDGRIAAHLVIEQHRSRKNNVVLSDRCVDRFGQPQAAIDWSVRDPDIAAFDAAAAVFLNAWQCPRVAGRAELYPAPAEDWQQSLRRGGGIYHPVGTAPIGRSEADGVVDSDLRTFAIPNLHVASTAVFPTAGGANPTQMLLLCCLDLAQRLAAKLRAAGPVR